MYSDIIACSMRSPDDIFGDGCIRKNVRTNQPSVHHCQLEGVSKTSCNRSMFNDHESYVHINIQQ